MKVKIFAYKNTQNLEDDINEFLKTVSNVIDIKYSSSNEYSEALIMYDEREGAQ